MTGQAAIAGSAREGTYSQTFTTGNFFIVLSLSGEDSVDMELGRNTLAKIEEMVYQTPAMMPSEIVNILADEFKNGIKLDLAVAKISAQKLQLAGSGNVAARLIRDGKVVNLLGKSTSVSGPILEDDLVILATTGFIDLLDPTDFLGSQDVEELKDQLLPKVEALADNSKVAALLIGIDLAEDSEESVAEALPEKSENRLSPVIDNFKNKYLAKIISPRGLYLKNVYGDTSSPQFRKTIYLAIVVFIILISLIAFQLRSRSIEAAAKTISAMDAQVQQSEDSAQKLSGVNDNIARDILLQARRDFTSKAEATFGTDWQNKKTAETGRLKTILAALDAKITQISHITNLSQLTVFYDFGLLKSGVKVVSASLSKNEIFAVDPTNGAAYSVGTKNKTASILIGSDDLKTAKFIDGTPDNAYILAANGIYQTGKLIIKASDKWGDIRGLRTFGGNLYLLDATNSQVWKYQGTENGFGDIAPYLKSGSLDFSKVVSWAIDGYVYVLSTSGNVVRFASGYGDDAFKITGLPDPLSNPTSIFVSDETENIYVLDNNGSRVIVLDKKGAYLAEYVLPNPVAGTLLADESVKKVFLVSGDKVFSFDLR